MFDCNATRAERFIDPAVAEIVISGGAAWAGVAEAPLYEVSTDGEVRRIGTTALREQAIAGRDYAQLNLNCGGRTKTVKTHRLVAKAFLRNDDGLPAINHLDGVKTNNHVSNLEWCTHRDNSLHSSRVLHNLRGEDNPASQLTEEQVSAIRKADGPHIALAKKYGVSVPTIIEIRRRNIWTLEKTPASGVHYRGKTTPEMIAAVRSAQGAQSDIARRFGIAQTHVSRIKRGYAPRFERYGLPFRVASR